MSRSYRSKPFAKSRSTSEAKRYHKSARKEAKESLDSFLKGDEDRFSKTLISKVNDYDVCDYRARLSQSDYKEMMK